MGDLGKVRPKSWNVYTTANAPVMNVVIAMCEEAGEAHAPAFPGKPVFCQWNFADPLEAAGDETEQKRVFEQVFRQILRRISVFVALPLQSMQAGEQRVAVNSMDEHAPPSIASE
jgi:arsenate reductase